MSKSRAEEKVRQRVFKKDATREWATDFLIGIGMFLLVIFFASAHPEQALPAPLAKTQAVLDHNLVMEQLGSIASISAVPARVGSQIGLNSERSVLAFKSLSDHIMMMVFMALAFSVLTTLTIHFWRNLRRAYASPRRVRGKSERRH